MTQSSSAISMAVDQHPMQLWQTFDRLYRLFPALRNVVPQSLHSCFDDKPACLHDTASFSDHKLSELMLRSWVLEVRSLMKLSFQIANGRITRPPRTCF